MTRTGSDYSLWTGSQAITLSSSTFAPSWTVPDALGPGMPMAGRILVPVKDAIAVLDPTSGAETARIPVQRKESGTAPITMGVVGNTIFEQRGQELVALS